MYGRASDVMQSRSRRAAAAAPTNGGIEASDAFKPDLASDSTAERVFQLTQVVQNIQARLTAMSARGIGPKHPDRRRIAHEFQEASNALSRVKGKLKAENRVRAAERESTFERAFIGVAKQMLAEPVYDRLIAAALHRIHEAHD